MTDLFRRLMSAGAAVGLVAVTTISVSAHSRAADLDVTAQQTLQTVTDETAVAAGTTPSIAHHWPG